jgi:hypothetical protein
MGNESHPVTEDRQWRTDLLFIMIIESLGDEIVYHQIVQMSSRSSEGRKAGLGY